MEEPQISQIPQIMRKKSDPTPPQAGQNQPNGENVQQEVSTTKYTKVTKRGKTRDEIPALLFSDLRALRALRGGFSFSGSGQARALNLALQYYL